MAQEFVGIHRFENPSVEAARAKVGFEKGVAAVAGAAVELATAVAGDAPAPYSAEPIPSWHSANSLHPFRRIP